MIAYLFRTTTARFVLVAAVAVETLNYLDRGRPWRGETLWSVDWAGTGLLILGPVLAGFAAYESARLNGEGVAGATHSLPAPRRRFLLSAGSLAAVASAVHLAFMAVYLVEAADLAVAWRQAAALVAVQCGSLFVVAGLGSAIGALLGRLSGPLVAAVTAGFLEYRFGRSSGVFAPFDLGGSTSSLLGARLSWAFLVQQALVLCLAGLLLITVQHNPFGGRRSKGAAVAAVVAALVAVAASPAAATTGERLVVDEEPPELQCAGTSPELCLYVPHERFRAATAATLLQIYLRAEEAGLPADVLPARVVERFPSGGRLGEGTAAVLFLPDSFATGTPDPASLAHDLVTPTHCDVLYGEEPPPEAFFDAQERLVWTLISWAGLQPDVEFLSDSAPLGTSEFVAVYDDMQRCRS